MPTWARRWTHEQVSDVVKRDLLLFCFQTRLGYAPFHSNPQPYALPPRTGRNENASGYFVARQPLWLLSTNFWILLNLGGGKDDCYFFQRTIYDEQVHIYVCTERE